MGFDSRLFDAILAWFSLCAVWKVPQRPVRFAPPDGFSLSFPRTPAPATFSKPLLRPDPASPTCLLDCSDPSPCPPLVQRHSCHQVPLASRCCHASSISSMSGPPSYLYPCPIYQNFDPIGWLQVSALFLLVLFHKDVMQLPLPGNSTGGSFGESR